MQRRSSLYWKAVRKMFKIRIADNSDAEELFRLNEEFNSKDVTELSLLKKSLERNGQEIVFIAHNDSEAVGFCCVQIFKSMCYSQNYAEITELYVNEKYRRQGAAAEMFRYIEKYFADENIGGYQLFTGGDNISAQAFYEKQGYVRSDEIMYRKRL